MSLKVSFIGNGNVGSHMADNLASAGAAIVQICSPSRGNMDLFDPTKADVVIISVTDDVIPDLLESLPSAPGTLWLHTSGSVGIDVFDSSRFPRCGVLYPLQTLLKGQPADWSKVPLFIEGSDPMIREVALMLTPSVGELDSLSRRRIHAAAVVGCNLVMYLWSLSERIMDSAGLDFNLLTPLFELTSRRGLSGSPSESLTGPARRGDVGTMRKHLEALPEDIAEVYRLLSNNILAQFHPEKKL